jgi:hypothetical protein
MAIDWTAVGGADLLQPEAKDRVMRLIGSLPLNTGDKAALYFDWARQAGVKATQEDARQVANLKSRGQVM